MGELTPDFVLYRGNSLKFIFFHFIELTLIYGHRLSFTQRKRRSGRTINDEKTAGLQIRLYCFVRNCKSVRTINPFRKICNLPVYFALALVRVSP